MIEADVAELAIAHAWIFMYVGVGVGAYFTCLFLHWFWKIDDYKEFQHYTKRLKELKKNKEEEKEKNGIQ
jgi:hypothetical protein